MEQAKVKTSPRATKPCRHCGIQLVFVETEEGRAMPCEGYPIVLQKPQERELFRGTRLIAEETGKVYLPDLAPLATVLWPTHSKNCPAVHLPHKSDRKRQAERGGVGR